MKTTVIVLLTLGLALADPISKQTLSADNNPAPSLNCSESETKHNEETNLNKGNAKQKNQVNENFDIIAEVAEEQIPSEEALIQEGIDLQIELASQPDGDITLADSAVDLTEDVYANEIIEKNPDEIMETAAGFVPIPIIRRRQKPRRRVATRRHHYVRNPYRRLYYTYPYPYYYGYYRPSSLRYYY